MLVKINTNWAVNILKIKDIGLSNDDKKKIHITWLDGTTDSYNASSEIEARKYVDQIIAATEKFWSPIQPETMLNSFLEV